MNIVSNKALKIGETDRKQAEISFSIFSQSPNDAGFIDRFLNENIVIEPVFKTKDGKINTDGDGSKGARFRVVVQKREPVEAKEPEVEEQAQVQAPPKITKKKATKKVTDA